MRRLTKIDQAQQAGNITFSPEDLRFLYEVEGPIEGFGYEPDPRIKEIKKLRNWKEDMGAIYEISSDNELIVQLLEKGEISKIREHINSFENLSADTADRLIVSGNGSLVAYHFDQFETLNRNDIAQRLIDTDQGHILVNRLFEFEDLNHVELASTLIEKRQGFAVARNLHDFEGLDSNDIVQRLIDTGQGEALVSNFEKFPSINHLDTALKLLDTGQSTALARNLHNFEGLTADVAYRLVREQYGYSVSNDLDKFADIDQNEIAHQMIETGQAEQLVKSLKNFKDIDHTDIAIRIIESGHAKDFLENLESFADIDEAIVVSKLIDREDYQLICWKIGLFNNIDKSEIAKRLISLKQGALVSGNLDNFGDINHEEVTTQLIETGQVKELLDNFSSFSRVQNRIELLQQCVEAGYVEELLRKLERKSYYGMNEVLSQLSIAEMLLETGHDKELFNNLDKFDNIPRLARRMMASGHESVLAENLSLLRYQSEELLPKEIAYQLFEGGHYDDVLYNMEVFDSVDKNKIFDMAMEAGQEKLVLRYLEKFIGLESQKMTEVFKKIIESGAAGSVGWRLEHWPGTLEPEIADLLIKNHESWNVVCYPERFKGLDQAKIAQDLIANNQAGYVSLLPKFSEFDQAELSRQMIDSGQVWAVVSHLKEFSHLGYQNAFRLLRKGKILPVLANLKSFRK
jgi:hypothetical protein